MHSPTRHIVSAIMALTLGAMPLCATAKGWEPLKSERTEAKSVLKDHDVEIKSAKNVIIITNNKQIQIKIFTILGRLVNNETLQPGTSQFVLPAHGVYVVQAGDVTCKIAV